MGRRFKRDAWRGFAQAFAERLFTKEMRAHLQHADLSLYTIIMNPDKAPSPELVRKVISKFLSNLSVHGTSDGVIERLKDVLTLTEKPSKQALEAAMFGDDAIS